MTTFVDPAYRDGMKFQSVIVFAHGTGLEERQIIEGTVVESFRAKSIRALRGVDVAPPTREYTSDEWAIRVLASGVESVLLVVVGGKDVDQTYVPPTYHPGTTYGTATTYGNMTYMNFYQTPGYTTGGYTVSKPVAGYSATLMSVADGTGVWTADAVSQGSAFNDFNDLSRSVAEETVERLLADGLFEVPKQD